MLLDREGQLIDDRYVAVSSAGETDANVPVLLTADLFLEAPEEWLQREGSVGVIWPNDRRIAELAPYLDRIALVVLHFPTFRDGRAYSQARQLRENYAFRGALRCSGQILRDQFLFLLRAGFDFFEVSKAEDAAAFAAAIARYSVFYQPTADGRLTAAGARRLSRPATENAPPLDRLRQAS
jgi:uncharacterized protein (DUF934 family)